MHKLLEIVLKTKVQGSLPISLAWLIERHSLMKSNQKCLLLFLEVKSCIFWKTLKTKATKVFSGWTLQKRRGFCACILCLCSTCGKHPVLFMKMYLFGLQVLTFSELQAKWRDFAFEEYWIKLVLTWKVFHKMFLVFFKHLFLLLLDKLNGGDVIYLKLKAWWLRKFTQMIS